MDDQNNQNTTGMFTSNPYDGDALKDSGENNPFFRELTANSTAGTPSSPVIPPQAPPENTDVQEAPVMNAVPETPVVETPVVNVSPETPVAERPVMNTVPETPVAEAPIVDSVQQQEVPVVNPSAAEPVANEVSPVQTQTEVNEVVNKPLEDITPEVQVAAPVIEEPAPVIETPEPVSTNMNVGESTPVVNTMPEVTNMQNEVPVEDVAIETPIVGLAQEAPTSVPLGETQPISENVTAANEPVPTPTPVAEVPTGPISEPVASPAIDVKSDLMSDLDSVANTSPVAPIADNAPAVSTEQPTVATKAEDGSKNKLKDIALIVIVIVLALLALILGIMLAKNSVPV